jgi:hypothetical protein
VFSEAYVQADLFTAFYNRTFKKHLKEIGTQLFSVHSPQKAAMVERFNRTLKTKMFRYFTYKNSTRWIDILPKLIKSYNHTKHSSIAMRPIDAKQKEHWFGVWLNNNLNHIPKQGKLKVDDFVRVSRIKNIFEKGYTPNWSEQIYKISNIDARDLPIMYHLIDYNNENIEGKFYKQELQKVVPPDTYPIEKIYKRQGNKHLVKFLGYPDKYWVKSIESSL